MADSMTSIALERCPRCWETAVNMADPDGYKYRVCRGCGHVVSNQEAPEWTT